MSKSKGKSEKLRLSDLTQITATFIFEKGTQFHYVVIMENRCDIHIYFFPF